MIDHASIVAADNLNAAKSRHLQTRKLVDGDDAHGIAVDRRPDRGDDGDRGRHADVVMDGRAMSVPDNMDNHLERMRLRVEIILARDRHAKLHHSAKLQKCRPAVPAYLVRDTLAVAHTGGRILASASLEISKVFGPAMSTADISETSMEAIYQEYLKADAAYRVPLSNALINSVKKMTNQQAMLYLLMHVISGEEKVAREKVPIIQHAEKKQKELSDIQIQANLEISTLKNKVKYLTERAAEHERNINIYKIERERLQEALTLAILTHKQETEIMAIDKTNLEGVVQSLSQQLEDLRSEHQTNQASNLQDKTTVKKYPSNIAEHSVDEIKNIEINQPQRTLDLGQFITKPVSDQFHPDDQKYSNNQASMKIKGLAGTIEQAAQDSPLGQSSVAESRSNAHESKRHCPTTVNYKDDVVEYRDKISELEKEVCLKTAEIDRLSQLYEVNAKQIEIKSNMRLASIRDDNIVLKKRILWLKEKLMACVNHPQPPVESSVGPQDESTRMLVKLKAGIKSIEDRKRLEQPEDLSKTTLLQEEVDHLKIKISELLITLDYYQRSESQRLSVVRQEQQQTIEKLTIDLLAAKEDLKQESNHRKALERIVTNVATDAKDDIAMEKEDSKPEVRDASYFTKLVDVISRQRQSTAGGRRLQKLAKSQINKGNP